MTKEDQSSIAASLRVMMNIVDEFEKKTGKGGWYAETMQENCTFIAKLCGIGPYPEFRAEPVLQAGTEPPNA